MLVVEKWIHTQSSRHNWYTFVFRLLCVVLDLHKDGGSRCPSVSTAHTDSAQRDSTVSRCKYERYLDILYIITPRSRDVSSDVTCTMVTSSVALSLCRFCRLLARVRLIFPPSAWCRHVRINNNSSCLLRGNETNYIFCCRDRSGGDSVPLVARKPLSRWSRGRVIFRLHGTRKRCCPSACLSVERSPPVLIHGDAVCPNRFLDCLPRVV